LFVILVGLAGCMALLNVPYELLNENFTVATGGPFILVSLIVGTLMFWGAWRPLRRRRVESPTA
jgi:hypothetical protein